MIGYDALEPYIKDGGDMVLEAELKTIEGMPDRLARMQAQLADVLDDLELAKRVTAMTVMRVKKIQGEAQDIIEGVQK